MQIESNSYYLEMVMNQSLVNNFAINCNKPKVNTIEQDTPQEDGPNRLSPCLSNWSDYLHVKDNTDNESPDQTKPPAEVDPNLTYYLNRDMCTPNLHADSNAILRLPQPVPKALTIEKGKSKGK